MQASVLRMVHRACLLLLVTLVLAPSALAAPASVEVRVHWSPDPESGQPPPLLDALIWADCASVSPVPQRAVLTVRTGGVVPSVVALAPGGRVTVSNDTGADVSMRLTRGRVVVLQQDLPAGNEVTTDPIGATDRPLELEATTPGVPTLRATVRILDFANARSGSDGGVPLRLSPGVRTISMFHPLVGELRWPGFTLDDGEVAVLDLVGRGERWDAVLRRRESVAPPPAGRSALMGRVVCAGSPCRGLTLGADGGVPGAIVFAGPGPLAPLAVTDPDGRFRIEGLPAGPLEVVVWHPNLGEHREASRLTAGAVTVSNYAYHEE